MRNSDAASQLLARIPQNSSTAAWSGPHLAVRDILCREAEHPQDLLCLCQLLVVLQHRLQISLLCPLP